MTCQHRHIGFGSGDYYIFCRQCSKRWALVGDQPEYGTSAEGRPIGANPILASSEGNPREIIDNTAFLKYIEAADKLAWEALKAMSSNSDLKELRGALQAYEELRRSQNH